MSPAGKPRRAKGVSRVRVVALVTDEESADISAAVKSRKQSIGELVREGLAAIGVLKKGKKS